MTFRTVAPRIKRSGVTLACLATALLTVSAVAQQPAAGQPPRRAGGGFTQPEPIDWDNHEGWTSLFDGKTLNGWDGPSDVWHYADGAIVGESSDANPSGTTNIIYKGGEYANFRLRLEMKLEGAGANGGIQYRSKLVPPVERPMPADAPAEMKARMAKNMELLKKHAKWNMAGYQADYDYSNRYTGQLYEQSSPRGIITYRGQIVIADTGVKKRLMGSVGDTDALKQFLKPDDWNQVEIIADGHTLTHIINGHVMSVTVDTDAEKMAATGLIALEIEGGGTLKISHRNIFIKKLP
ncbi:DUF1080 domain-containing protein [soil metagenome]